MLKKLQRNVQMLFPVKFDDIDPDVIRQKLYKLYEEGIAREDIAQLQLRLKSHFLDESLEVIVKLATDVFNTIKDQNTIDVTISSNQISICRTSSGTNLTFSMWLWVSYQRKSCCKTWPPTKPSRDRNASRLLRI
jgi:hypothetical protein